MQNLNSHSLQRMCVFFLMTTNRLSYKAIVISNNSDAKKNCLNILKNGNFKKITKNEKSFSPKRCTNLGTTPNIHSHYCYILKVYSINAFHLILPQCSKNLKKSTIFVKVLLFESEGKINIF